MALAHEYARQSLPTFTQRALEPNMKRFVLVSATAASLLIAPAAEARAQGSAQPAPWNSYGSTLYATGTDIWVKFFGADAGYTSSLFFVCDLLSSCNQYLFQNNGASAAGQEVKINHTFAVGEEVIFKLFVGNTSDTWFTGPARSTATPTLTSPRRGSTMSRQTPPTACSADSRISTAAAIAITMISCSSSATLRRHPSPPRRSLVRSYSWLREWARLAWSCDVDAKRRASKPRLTSVGTR